MPEPGGPPGDKVPTEFALSIGTQASHAVFDPAFATASRLDVDLGNLGLVTTSPKQHQEQHIDRYVMQATLEPHDGRLDLVQQGTITGWRSASRVGDTPAVAFGADHIEAHGRIDGIDRDHAAALVDRGQRLARHVAPRRGDAARRRGAVAPRHARRCARSSKSLRGIVTGMQGEETIEGLHIAVAGQGEATVRQVRLGIDGAAPDGMLHAAFDIALDGLAVQDLPPQATSLVPHHVELRPSVAGVSLAGLTALALEATDQDADQAQDAGGRRGPAGAWWRDAWAGYAGLDVGPAELHGQGHVAGDRPGRVSGRGACHRHWAG